MPDLKKNHRGRRRASFALVVVLCALAAPISGSAHGTANGFVDRFATLGPLAGYRPSDPWEVKSGDWKVIDQQFTETPPLAEANRILLQNSKATTPLEPIAFVRARSYRQLAVQVTAAMMDPTNALGDVANSASVGIVFRAPLSTGIADKDNLYLFTAIVVGPSRDFPSGKAYALWKRVGRGYYLLHTRVVPTWEDFTRPHDYKVIMALGHIQAFVDGRLVIEHTDVPSGDNPTPQDPFPGLPFDQGAVGLRTSGTRAWFDNFMVVGNDAYEGRANVLDSYANYGIAGNGQVQVRRGVTLKATHDLEQLSADLLDTTFQYHDHDYDEAVLSPVENPTGGQPSFGASVRSGARNGVVTSSVKVAGINVGFADPTKRVAVQFSADSVEISGSADCSHTDSRMQVIGGTLRITASGAGNLDLPIPLKHEYPPNTVIFERPTLLTVIAHSRVVSTAPHRIEMAALRIVFPEGGGVTIPAVGSPVQNLPVATPRTSEVTIESPPVEVTFGNVVAGRYCP